MKIPEESQRNGAWWLPILEKLPVISCYAQTRGWHYLISWLHRLTGIGLVIYLIVHLYTLSLLPMPDLYNAQLKMMAWPLFLFLAWVASLLVGFHALNGGRLLLYELFGQRNDAAMLRWTFGLVFAYAAMVGLIMIMKNQSASPVFFWMVASFAGAVTTYAVWARIWKSRHAVLWKLQRISGAFLLVTAPAYLLFLYLNQGDADAQANVARMQSSFVRIALLAMAAAALYHAGYGLFSILADYVSARLARAGITALIVVVFAVLTFLAFRAILSI